MQSVFTKMPAAKEGAHPVLRMGLVKLPHESMEKEHIRCAVFNKDS